MNEIKVSRPRPEADDPPPPTGAQPVANCGRRFGSRRHPSTTSRRAPGRCSSSLSGRRSGGEPAGAAVALLIRTIGRLGSRRRNPSARWGAVESIME
jgi:hypothetical protein